MTCERCGGGMYGAYSVALGATSHYVCPACKHEQPPGPPPTAPASDPCEPPADAWDGRECDLVQAIREDGARCGYRVDRVGQHRADRAGQDRGVGDLFLRLPSWPRAQWIAAECKVLGGTFSAEQRLRIERGELVPVWSVRQAREAVGL